MSAAIDSGPAFRWTPPTPLFSRPIRVPSGVTRSGVHYDVAPDGRTFVAVLNNEVGNAESAGLRVFVNWRSALRPR
jgi:hypothetical protein